MRRCPKPARRGTVGRVSSPSAAVTACTRCFRAAPARRRRHRGGDGGGRRRLVRPAAPRAARRSCRPATCGWRWPPWRRRTTDGRLWRPTFQHRFGGNGALAGHPVGNIVLVGLAEVLGRSGRGAATRPALLGARGRVLPMSGEPLDIVAEVAGLDDDPPAVRRIRGQVAVAATPGRVRRGRSWSPTDAAGLPGGGRGGTGRRPGDPRPGVVVHQRAAAPDGAGAADGDLTAPRRTGSWC